MVVGLFVYGGVFWGGWVFLCLWFFGGLLLSCWFFLGGGRGNL